MRGRAIAFGSVLGGVVLFACLGPTQITLHVTADLPCARIKGTSIHSGSTQLDAPLASTKDCALRGAGADIGTLVLTPSGDKDEAFTVSVVMGVDVPTESCASVDYKGCIVAKRRARYIPHEALEMPIQMSEACLGLVCDPSQTCFRGVCVSAEVVRSDGCLGPDCTSNPGGAAPDVSPPVADATLDVVPLSDGSRVDSGNPADASAGEVFELLMATQGQPRGLYLTSSELVWSEVSNGMTSVRVWPLGSSPTLPLARCQRSYDGYGVHVSEDGTYAGVARSTGACEDRCALDGGAPSVAPFCDAGVLGVAHVPGSTVYVGPTATQRGSSVVISAGGGAYAEALGTSVFFTRQLTVIELEQTDNVKAFDLQVLVGAELHGIAVTSSHFFLGTKTGAVYVANRSTKANAKLLDNEPIAELGDLAYHEPSGTLYLAARVTNMPFGIYRYTGFQARLP